MELDEASQALIYKFLPNSLLSDRTGNHARQSFLHPITWLLALTASLLTTKYLLDHEFHFPMHLLAIQLAAALALRFLRFVRDSRRGSNSQTQDAPNQDGRLRLLFAICIAGFLVCGYQAILHWRNLPVVVMVLSPDLEATMRRGSTLRSTLMQGLQVIGISLVFVFDFRLSNVGVSMLLISAIFGLLARILIVQIKEQEAYSRNERDDVFPWQDPRTGELCLSYLQRIDLQTLALIASLALALFWSFFREQQFPKVVRAYTPLSSGSAEAVTFVMNILLSVIALDGDVTSRSSLTDHTPASSPKTKSWSKTTTSIALVSLVTLGSACGMELPARLDVWQLIGFGLVSIAGFWTENGTIGQRPYGWLSADEESEARGHMSRGLFDRGWRAMERSLSGGRLLIIIPVSFFCAILTANAVLGDANAFRSIDSTFDNSSRADATLDIVVAHHDEPVLDVVRHLREVISLPKIHLLNPTIRIYNKGTSSSEDLEEFQSVLVGLLSNFSTPIPEVRVEKLDNVGRETDTFLDYITANYDDLANHTLFMQAHPHFGPWGYTRRIQDYFTWNTGFLSLGKVGDYCSSCDHCHDRDWSEQPALLREVYADFNDGAECGEMTLTYRGQFIISADRIRSNKLATYKRWMDELRDPQGRLHTPPYTESSWSRKNDSMSSPRAGFTFERMWGVMMRCSEKRIAENCPSMLASLVHPAKVWSDVDLEDCQCLDDRT